MLRELITATSGAARGSATGDGAAAESGASGREAPRGPHAHRGCSGCHWQEPPSGLYLGRSQRTAGWVHARERTRHEPSLSVVFLKSAQTFLYASSSFLLILNVWNHLNKGSHFTFFFFYPGGWGSWKINFVKKLNRMYLFRKLPEKVNKWHWVLSCHRLCYQPSHLFFYPLSCLLVIFLLISYLSLGWTRNEMEF